MISCQASFAPGPPATAVCWFRCSPCRGRFPARPDGLALVGLLVEVRLPGGRSEWCRSGGGEAMHATATSSQARPRHSVLFAC